MKNIYLLLLLISLGSNAQQPFRCDAAYMTVHNGNVTNIYRVEQQNDGSLITSLLTTANVIVNGVGLRRQDFLMYGLSDRTNPNGSYNFYQIGADGKTKILQQMPFDNNYQYYSGDVTVNGKFMVILANGQTPNKLYIVDLLDANYGFKAVDFPIGVDINSPDIAFSPDGSVLYAYNAATKKLIEIDYENAKIIKETSNTSIINGSFSGIWAFDCHLFGYNRQLESFLKIELEGKSNPFGFITQETKFPFPSNQGIDGCACPPPVKMFKFAKKTVNPDTCVTEFKFFFAIENKCGIEQKNINFEDVLPKEFTIVKVDKNPFGGVITKSVGGNIFKIENFNIPNKNDTIVITTRLKTTLGKSVFKNQAFLYNIRHQDGNPITVPSDDPTTTAFLDSTTVKAPLLVSFSKDTISLCPDSKAVLKPKVEGENLVFDWNNGEKTPTITVKKAGIYSVTVTSGCDFKIDTQVVINTPLSLEIGDDRHILPGDSIIILPVIAGYNPIATYDWIGTKGSNLVFKNKSSNISKPNEEDVTVMLKLTDDQNCMVNDKLTIKMRRNLYIPNVFSPDDNSINDAFYPFTEARATIEEFQVFDRWGSLIFEQKQCNTNDPKCGWDGTFKNQNCEKGVYTYRVAVKFLDNVVVNRKGDVTLLR
jgi:gliding motility-associated-like protein